MQVILLFLFIYFTILHFLSVPAFDSAEQLNLRCFYRFVDFKTESPKPTRKFKFCYRAWNYMWLYEENLEIHNLVLMVILYNSLIQFWGKFVDIKLRKVWEQPIGWDEFPLFEYRIIGIKSDLSILGSDFFSAGLNKE